MDIAVCTDKNYIMPCGIMLHTICMNNTESDITFHIVIDESVNFEMKKSLETALFPITSKKINFYLINGNSLCSLPKLDESNPKSYITKAAYYRLFLAAILPNDINKVLYLDCDIIVRHSIADLWNTDLEDYSVGVIPDVGEGVIDKYNRLRYPFHKGYFNSGVLLINLKKWREDDMLSKFLSFINEHPDWIKLHDQDVMNKVFCDDKLILPIKYNFQEGFLWKEMFYDYWKYEAQVIEARKDPVIIHFTDSKPWMAGCEHPMKALFFEYQQHTKWAGTPLMYKGPKPTLKLKIKDTIKDFLIYLGIATPRPVYPSKYIDTIE